MLEMKIMVSSGKLGMNRKAESKGIVISADSICDKDTIWAIAALPDSDTERKPFMQSQSIMGGIVETSFPDSCFGGNRVFTLSTVDFASNVRTATSGVLTRLAALNCERNVIVVFSLERWLDASFDCNTC